VEVQNKMIDLMKEYKIDFTGIKLKVGSTTHGWELEYPKEKSEVYLKNPKMLEYENKKSDG
jgi:hypothetical protein